MDIDRMIEGKKEAKAFLSLPTRREGGRGAVQKRDRRGELGREREERLEEGEREGAFFRHHCCLPCLCLTKPPPLLQHARGRARILVTRRQQPCSQSGPVFVMEKTIKKENMGGGKGTQALMTPIHIRTLSLSHGDHSTGLQGEQMVTIAIRVSGKKVKVYIFLRWQFNS